MKADTQAFDAILADVDTPLYIVTVAAGEERGGCLVGFATQCSIKPPRFGVWLSKVNRTYRIAQRASTVLVHLLREGDRDLARLFGGETGDQTDKFRNLELEVGPNECPVIPRCDWFAGSILDRVDTGDHVAYVLAPWGGKCERRGERQLRYREISDVEAGHPVPDD